MPSGAARTRGSELLIDHPVRPRRLGDLLPDAFGLDDLPGNAGDRLRIRRPDRHPHQT